MKQEIPKADVRTLVLGIPTVADRIAQGVVKLFLEPILDPKFHPDSYGYRPGRSAHDALEITRQRVWRYDWGVEVDIKAFFDNVSHELILKALRFHQVRDWVLLYAKRWLEAEMIDREGNATGRKKGTPQGSISLLLANLFLHHGMDEWMQRYHPEIPFARYADDAVLHCRQSAARTAHRQGVHFPWLRFQAPRVTAPGWSAVLSGIPGRLKAGNEGNDEDYSELARPSLVRNDDYATGASVQCHFAGLDQLLWTLLVSSFWVPAMELFPVPTYTLGEMSLSHFSTKSRAEAESGP